MAWGARAGVVGAVVWLALAASPAQAGLSVSCGGGPQGTIVAIPGGGFFLKANRSQLRRLCKGLSGGGFRVVAVQYPVFDYPGALRTVQAATRRRGRVYAYGESVGGTLAARLAFEGRVDAAVTNGSPFDLTVWPAYSPDYWAYLAMSRSERKAASPLFMRRRSRAPLLVTHSPTDVVVPYSHGSRMARRLGTRVLRLRGDHLTDPSAPRHALRWLRRRTR